MNTQPQQKAFSADLPTRSALVDEHGYLTIGAATSQLRFGFVVDDVSYQARLLSKGTELTLLVMGDIAAMPYTAQSPTARSALLALLVTLEDQPWGTCGLSKRHHIAVMAELPVANPTTPLTLVTTAIHFVIKSQACAQQVQQELSLHSAMA